MGKRKTNPHRIPCTMADVERAKTAGAELGILLCLWTLADAGCGHEALKETWRRIWETADSIQRHYITWEDIRRTLEEEYKVTTDLEGKL